MDAVTGAFGFIGRYITRDLLDSGGQVRTVTTHPDKPNPFGDVVSAFPFNFDQPSLLRQALVGCDVLYNTYWIRFDHGSQSFENTAANTKILVDAAKDAGVKRIVHISVTNILENDHLPYFRGKAIQEQIVRESGLPFSIVSPTLVYGSEDILVNNIAWTVRKFPLVPVFGDGKYRVQPIFVEDLAKIAVKSSTVDDSTELDAIGPETFTYEEFIRLIKSATGGRARLFHITPWLGIALGRIIGLAKRDVLLTRDELVGLMESRLCSDQTPNGTTRFSEWVMANGDSIGLRHVSELDRHFRWKKN